MLVDRRAVIGDSLPRKWLQGKSTRFVGSPRPHLVECPYELPAAAGTQLHTGRRQTALPERPDEARPTQTNEHLPARTPKAENVALVHPQKKFQKTTPASIRTHVFRSLDRDNTAPTRLYGYHPYHPRGAVPFPVATRRPLWFFESGLLHRRSV